MIEPPFIAGSAPAGCSFPWGRHTLPRHAKGNVLKQLRLGVAAALAVLVLVIPTPSYAGSVWDPDEAGHHLDVRWAGVYEQGDGRLRITITFYDRIRQRLIGGGRVVRVEFAPDRDAYYYAYFSHDSGRWWASLCESGSTCPSSGPVFRPNAKTLRVRLTGPPDTDWNFRVGTGLRSRIDLTRRAEIT